MNKQKTVIPLLNVIISTSKHVDEAFGNICYAEKKELPGEKSTFAMLRNVLPGGKKKKYVVI